HDESNDGLAGRAVGATHHGRLGHQRVRHQRGFHFHGTEAVTRDVQHVVDAAHDPEIAVGVALGTVAGQVGAVVLGGEVALREPLAVAPDRADQGGPRTLDDQETATTRLDLATRFIDDGGVDAWQGQRARTWLQWSGTRQRGDHVHTGFGLPPRIDHRAAFAAHTRVVPDQRTATDRIALPPDHVHPR